MMWVGYNASQHLQPNSFVYCSYSVCKGFFPIIKCRKGREFECEHHISLNGTTQLFAVTQILFLRSSELILRCHKCQIRSTGWLQAVEKAKLNLNILNVKETDKDSINSNQVLWNKVGSKAEENLNSNWLKGFNNCQKLPEMYSSMGILCDSPNFT